MSTWPWSLFHNKKPVPPVEPERFAQAVLASGLAFFVSTLAVRLVAGRIGITSAHRGEFLVAYGGLVTSMAASVQAADAVLTRRWRSWDEVIGHASVERQLQLQLGMALFGLLAFTALGGRYYSLLPSDFASLGAFRNQAARNVATLEYAGARDRGAMTIAGRIVGCHTCGTRKSAEYIADHQPPLKFVKQANDTWLRRLVLGPMRQEFYPQCRACSTVQSHVVRLDGKRTHRPLHYHWTTLRAYHFTGLAIGLVFVTYKVDED